MYFATQYLLTGRIDEEDIGRIARDLLCNELIEEFRVKSKYEWEKSPGFEVKIPRVTGLSSDRVEIIKLTEMDDNELIKTSKNRSSP